ncbi:hypothetical protein PILCRDRAFT_83980 [Piloderma croceum F 1598]|uniref:Uncharacterized protein n=1 Tax=Piloderma croceum (strain F 1598) TaxID=765440 RepID=A0A0C3GJK9_PILCF|nr:hypothetical protein PILCRDRAFT_83980 [Piloderma croceum F 1598]
MPPKSPIWELYIGNKTLYKTDQSHFNAWCNDCLYGCMKSLQEADRANVIAGVMSYAHTQRLSCKHKISTMKNHAKSCHWFSDTYFGSLREAVLVRQAQMKDKENMNASASPVSNWTPFAPHSQVSPAARPLKHTCMATNVSYGDAPAYNNGQFF